MHMYIGNALHLQNKHSIRFNQLNIVKAFEILLAGLAFVMYSFHLIIQVFFKKILWILRKY